MKLSHDQRLGLALLALFAMGLAMYLFITSREADCARRTCSAGRQPTMVDRGGPAGAVCVCLEAPAR